MVGFNIKSFFLDINYQILEQSFVDPISVSHLMVGYKIYFKKKSVSLVKLRNIIFHVYSFSFSILVYPQPLF